MYATRTPRVRSPQVDIAAVWRAAAQVSGEVNSLVSSIWIGKEYGIGEVRLAPVPRGEVPALDGYLAHSVEADLIAIVIQQ